MTEESLVSQEQKLLLENGEESNDGLNNLPVKRRPRHKVEQDVLRYFSSWDGSRDGSSSSSSVLGQSGEGSKR